MNTLKILQPNLPRPLVVIVGPTAVGKTELSLRLASRLGGEIVSADSRLFYRGMNIGTAKPLPEEQARIPHHLIDVADPDETWSLSRFQKAATGVICAIHERGQLPFLVGGTGQYIRAVIDGWNLPEQEPDPVLRETLENWGSLIGAEELHRRLAVIDPGAASQIDWRNMRRTIRALEVTLRTGRPFSVQRLRMISPYSLLIIGLRRPRVELYQRVDERIQAMIDAGFVQEVQQLLNQGYSPNLPTMSAIGYREMCAYINGQMTLDQAIMQMKRLTRRFVRHQGAWFNEKDRTIHWFDADAVTIEELASLIQNIAEWQKPE